MSAHLYLDAANRYLGRELPEWIKPEWVEVTSFGDPERRYIEVSPRLDLVEWSIGQSRASYLAGTIMWWEMEDEVWEALNGKIPKRILPLDPPDGFVIEGRR